MDKNSFLMYLDYEEQFNLLSDSELGQLMRYVMEYEKTGKEPKMSGVIKMAFSFIKAQLDRDRNKWEEKKQKRSEAGKKGMENRWKKEEKDITNDNKNNNVINAITRYNKNN